MEENQNGSTITIPLAGEVVAVKRSLWRVSDLKLDPSNPRLGYLLRTQKMGMPATDEELHQILWDMDQVKDLFQSIYQNGGLIEDPIIKENGIVVEGNCRTVSLRELHKKYPSDLRWKHVYVRVLPTRVTEEQLMILLGELHVAGKIEWRAFDQAEYVWRMNKVFGKNYDYLASHLRWSRTKLSQKIAAYEATKDYIERTSDPQGVNRFSHFEEFMKKKALKDKVETEPDFIKEFGDWVHKGKFPDAKDVRHLPAILDNKDALNKFHASNIREAEAVLYRDNPSLVSNLYCIVDQASSELENVSLAEIMALKNGDKPKLDKLHRLVKAIEKLEGISGVKLS